MRLSPADDTRTDLELVAALNAGDSEAFDAIYYRYRDWVVRLARRFTGSDDDALDVLQETFAYLASRFPGFRLTARLTTFLYPAVRNISLAVRRKRRRFIGDAEAMDDVPAPPVPGDADTSRADLAAAMGNLPAQQREVLLMRFVDGMSLEEISVALGIPVGTVKSRLHNAAERLRTDARARAWFLDDSPRE